jgi:hypothetical protein
MIHVCFGDNAGNVATRPRSLGLPVPASLDVVVHASTGIVDSVCAFSVGQSPCPGSEE